MNYFKILFLKINFGTEAKAMFQVVPKIHCWAGYRALLMPFQPTKLFFLSNYDSL